MHTHVYSGAILGVDGFVVDVEVDISRGIPCFSIVGLPNTAVRESRERVNAALKNAGWEFPLRRVTVNLAPADIKKEGSAFDLATAVGILVASGQAPGDGGHLGRTLFLGELALDGTLRRVTGVLPVLLHARVRGFERAVIPQANREESLAVDGLEVVACRGLRDAAFAVFGAECLPEAPGVPGVPDGGARVCAGEGARASHRTAPPEDDVDMRDVRGQEEVKRALLVAAAGGHHALLVGPPGAGKTMLARRFTTTLPPLDHAAALETTMIYSIVGLLGGIGGLVQRPPLRAPHHSASDAGLIGGGAVPRPGEVTLAHNGVLFLDELPEFKRHVLETLREPLEEGRITISRARSAVTFPARFQLLAAMNPCPCGYHGSRERQCRCSPNIVAAYTAKISGPLLDRIAIQTRVRAVAVEAFRAAPTGVASESIRERVSEARAFAERRWGSGAGLNARVPQRRFDDDARVVRAADELLLEAQRRLRVSARGRAQVLRVARTIADLEASDDVLARHVAEAVQYRVGK